MAQYSFSYSSIISSEDCMLDDLEKILSENEVDIESGRRFMLVVSEAFNNAMMHGNRLNASKQIKLSLSINRTRLKADIVDQGVQGLKAIRSKLPCDILSESGRGIDLIRHYADEVDFAEDTKGNLRTTVKIFRTATTRRRKIIRIPTEDSMDTALRESNGVSILTLSGRLDLSSGSVLKDEVKELLGKEKISIHLNLASVEFINSSGLGVLVSIMKEIRLHKGRLTLSNLASYVLEIFEITQLSHIFEIYATDEEALSSFQTTATTQA